MPIWVFSDIDIFYGKPDTQKIHEEKSAGALFTF
jgi:hypothetical protein